MTAMELPDALRDLPATRNHVYRALADVDTATREDLAAATGLSERTISDATADLEAAGLVETATDATDARRKRYRIAERDSSNYES